MDGKVYVTRLLDEAKSLSRNERLKASEHYDELYVDEKIHHHHRAQLLSKVFVALLYVTALAGVVTVLLYEYLSEGAQLPVKILLVLLGVLCLVGIPNLAVNHARNASILRLVRALHPSRGTAVPESVETPPAPEGKP